MSINLAQLTEVLNQAFPNSKVFIEDTAGDGKHFEAQVISDIFLNKSSIQRHKMVYDALGSVVGKEMHAISIDARTFNESHLDNTTSSEIHSISTEDESRLSNDILKQIDQAIKKYEIILFMKGTKEQPMCGFSATVVGILQELNVRFMGVNVLASEEIRENIKIYSNWPTIPQLYIKGKFVGGCDIIRDMHMKGNLQKLLEKENLLVNN
ncbi:Grx4 family monothiol glutaredoxin [Candidatus Hepatincolaceae symbiont of Richtersius coronifer]